MYVAWLHKDLEMLAYGEEPTRIDRKFRQRILDSLGRDLGLRIWLEEHRP